MKKLCRHWDHRCDVELNEVDARIQLPFGQCRIDVDTEAMTFELSVSSSARIERAEEFVASHLIRMANRDQPEVNWVREDGSKSSVQSGSPVVNFLKGKMTRRSNSVSPD